MKLTLLSVVLDEELTEDQESVYRSGKLLTATFDGGRAWLLLSVPTVRS